MDYQRIELDDGAVVYKIFGGFHVFFWENIRKEVMADIQVGKVTYFMFDLSEVTNIDSLGISILVITGKYNYSKGHKLPVKSAPPHIKKLIQAADLIFIDYV
jgi:anti-anti-sigma regulatory factor